MKELLRRIAFVGIFIVAVLGYIGYKDVLIAFSTPVNIVEDCPQKYEEIENIKAVKTEFNMLLDCFASEEIITKNGSGAITDRKYDYYYIAPVYVAEEDDYYFVGVKTSGKNEKVYDKVCDVTWEYLYGEVEELETIEFEGGVYEMENEAYRLMKEWFKDAEWFESEKELKKYVLPLMLEPLSLYNVKKVTYICTAVLVLCIFLILLSFSKGRRKLRSEASRKTFVTINGFYYPASDFKKVNKLVEKGKKDKAVKALMNITGISETDAYAVILDWYGYWC